MAGATIGADCNIGDHAFIESGVVLGDRVTVKNGVAIWAGVTAEEEVFFGPNAVLTNDLRPRSKVYDVPLVPTLFKRGASVGANATILCGITVGQYALIGAGAVVTRDVPDHGLIVGNPGRLRGHVCSCTKTLRFDDGRAECSCSLRYVVRDSRVERSGVR